MAGWRLRPPAAWLIAWPIGALLFTNSFAQAPRTLPTPSVPLRSVPPAAAPASDAFLNSPRNQAGSGGTYSGPPGSIDGPEVLPPQSSATLPSESLPGEAAEQIIVDGGAPSMIDDDVVADDWPPAPIAANNAAALPQKISQYKDSFFQKLSLSADWLGNRSDPNDLGITEVEVFGQVGLPAPIREWPMLITHGFNLSMIQGPTVTNLPPRLYYAYTDFMWLPQIVKGYTLLISAVPSIYGDFQTHQFKMTGKGLLIVDLVPDRLQFVGGVLYLNRDNLRLLPAGGFIWQPADWTRFELIFPKPKLALRYNVGVGYEDWIYTTAEFGGNTWPIIRADGTRDFVTYLDYRILLGVERRLQGGAGYRFEAGYVFGRDIMFASNDGGFHPQDTFMLRGGITY